MGGIKNLNLAISDSSKPLRNIHHEKFCHIYISESEFFGSGGRSYCEAYGKDWENPRDRSTSGTASTGLLKHPVVLQRISYLLNTQIGFNDSNVDKQLAFLITQSADLRVKLQAIREYNALRGRIKRRLEVSLVDQSDEELDSELEALQEEIARAERLQCNRNAAHTIKGMPVLTPDQRAAMDAQAL